MNDNFTPTVTIALSVYQNMERRLADNANSYELIGHAIELFLYAKHMKANANFSPKSELEYKFQELIKSYENDITELKADNERLCRIVDGLQVQHRNDQGLD